jgi:hypothetical protein
MPPKLSTSDLGLTVINVTPAQAAAQPIIYEPQFSLKLGFHLCRQFQQGLGLSEKILIYQSNERFPKVTNRCGEFEHPYCKTEQLQLANGGSCAQVGDTFSIQRHSEKSSLDIEGCHQLYNATQRNSLKLKYVAPKFQPS